MVSMYKVTLIAFAVCMNSQIIISKRRDCIRQSEISIWQFRILQRQGETLLLRLCKRQIDNSNLIGIIIYPLLLGQHCIRSILFAFCLKHFTLAENCINNDIECIHLVIYMHEISLITLACGVDGQVIVAKHGDCIRQPTIGVWQLVCLESQIFSLHFGLGKSSRNIGDYTGIHIKHCRILKCHIIAILYSSVVKHFALTEDGIYALAEGVNTVIYVHEISLITLACSVDSQVIVTEGGNSIYQSAVSIWQIGVLKSQGIRYRLWCGEGNCHRSDYTCIRIVHRSIYKLRRGCITHPFVSKLFTLAQCSIYAWRIEGVNIMDDSDLHLLITFSVIKRQVMYAKALQQLPLIAIWQVFSLQMECIVVQFVGHKEHLGSGNSLRIAIF